MQAYTMGVSWGANCFQIRAGKPSRARAFMIGSLSSSCWTSSSVNGKVCRVVDEEGEGRYLGTISKSIQPIVQVLGPMT